MQLFVGCNGTSAQGRALRLRGTRCFTPASAPPGCLGAQDVRYMTAMLDSGAYSDPPASRLTPGEALARQLAWEASAAEKWGGWFRSDLLVSYDHLIDETWTGRWRRSEAIRVVTDAGLPTPPRSACYICTLRNNEEWRHLRDSGDGDWEKAIAQEREFIERDDEGGLYLHRSGVPLEEADIDKDEQPDLFGCGTGYCFT